MKWLVILLLPLVISCNNNETKHNLTDIDVKNIVGRYLYTAETCQAFSNFTRKIAAPEYEEGCCSYISDEGLEVRMCELDNFNKMIEKLYKKGTRR